MIGGLVFCCESAASAAGHLCIVEKSPGSESQYVHVRRRGLWYGVRISAHEPAYACSRDYSSVVVPRLPAERDIARLTRVALGWVRHGGRVVADPRDVRRATRQLDEFLQAGSRFTDARGRRWRWSAEHRVWACTSRPLAEVPAADRPTHRPRSLLSNRLRSSVRHSQNVLAKWAAEMSGETPMEPGS